MSAELECVSVFTYRGDSTEKRRFFICWRQGNLNDSASPNNDSVSPIRRVAQLVAYIACAACLLQTSRALSGARFGAGRRMFLWSVVLARGPMSAGWPYGWSLTAYAFTGFTYPGLCCLISISVLCMWVRAVVEFLRHVRWGAAGRRLWVNSIRCGELHLRPGFYSMYLPVIQLAGMWTDIVVTPIVFRQVGSLRRRRRLRLVIHLSLAHSIGRNPRPFRSGDRAPGRLKSRDSLGPVEFLRTFYSPG